MSDTTRKRGAAAAVQSSQPTKKHHSERPFALWSDPADAEATDRFPAAGRFSSALEDRFDRECVVRPLRLLTDDDHKQLHRQAIERIQVRDGRHREERIEPEKEEEEAVWEDVYRAMRMLAVDDKTQAEASMRINTRANLSCDLLRDLRMCRGDQILAAIRKCLNSLGYTRSQFQAVRKGHTQKKHADSRSRVQISLSLSLSRM